MENMPKERKSVGKGHRNPADAKAVSGDLYLRREKVLKKGIEFLRRQGEEIGNVRKVCLRKEKEREKGIEILQMPRL